MSSWEPKHIHDMHVRFLFACAMFFVMFACWQSCNMSSCSLLLHWLCVSWPKGALAPCHTSSPRNLHHRIVLKRASKVDHFLEQLLKYTPPPFV